MRQNYSGNKRKKEEARRKKQEDKRNRRLNKSKDTPDTPQEQGAAPEQIPAE
jgi:hypothetical protein